MIRPARGRIAAPPAFDALVVGAGPAGAAAAHRLASSGARVALLDAAAFPRDKPCGDAVSPGATPLLAELGVAADLERLGVPTISEWRVRSADGTWFAGRYTDRGSAPAHGFAVDRRMLDELLARAARRAGATLFARQRVFGIERTADGWRVLARGADGRARTWRAPVLIGADGLRSRTARLLAGVRRGGHPRLAIVGRLRAPEFHSEHGELRVGDGDPFVMGCAPLGQGRYNVTLVVHAGSAGEVSGATEAYFRQGMRSLGANEALVAGHLERALGVTGPFRVSPGRVAGPGWFLAGDAAGYFDPFTGQGIYQALHTGRLAARAALARLARPDDPAAIEAVRYAAAVRRALAPSRRVQYMIDAAIQRRSVFDALARWLHSRQSITARILDVTGDRLEPAESLCRPFHDDHQDRDR